MAAPFLIILAAASAAVAANQQRNAAKAQEIEFERQADEEKISAEGQELERRTRLNKILSANMVDLAGSGMSGEGTPQSISLDSAKQASISEGISSLSDRLKQSQRKRQAANARISGSAQAGSTLLRGASQIVGAG